MFVYSFKGLNSNLLLYPWPRKIFYWNSGIKIDYGHILFVCHHNLHRYECFVNNIIRNTTF